MKQVARGERAFRDDLRRAQLLAGDKGLLARLLVDVREVDPRVFDPAHPLELLLDAPADLDSKCQILLDLCLVQSPSGWSSLIRPDVVRAIALRSRSSTWLPRLKWRS